MVLVLKFPGGWVVIPPHTLLSHVNATLQPLAMNWIWIKWLKVGRCVLVSWDLLGTSRVLAEGPMWVVYEKGRFSQESISLTLWVPGRLFLRYIQSTAKFEKTEIDMTISWNIIWKEQPIIIKRRTNPLDYIENFPIEPPKTTLKMIWWVKCTL